MRQRAQYTEPLPVPSPNAPTIDGPLSPAKARAGLVNIALTLAPADDSGAYERMAMVLRDCLVALEIDPTDRAQLAGVFAGAWLALNQLCGAIPMPLPVHQWLYLVTEITRRWVDGELPIVSLSDMAGLPSIKPDASDTTDAYVPPFFGSGTTEAPAGHVAPSVAPTDPAPGDE